MRDREAAQMLAEAMVAIGAHTGVRTEALITGMDAPLGNTVGNALEIREAIDTLRGQGPADVMTLVTRIVSRMLVIGDIEPDQQAALARVQDALGSGRALETFARMIDRQGGNARVVEDDSLLPQAPARTEYAASRAGFVTRLGAHAIGQASNVLGAGRARVGDRIDHAVGVVLQVAVGDQVQERQPVLELHHRDGRGLDEALALCRDAVRIEDAPPSPGPRVLGEVR
jgi:thymidine phosphorylase